MHAFTYESTRREQVKGIENVSHMALPALLDLAITQAPSDPFQFDVARVLETICDEGKHLDKVDSGKLVEAIRSLMKMSNGGGRSAVANTFNSQLAPDELKLLWGDIYRATTESAPSGIMFADGVRGTGVTLMTEHGVKEGLQVRAELLTEDRWGAHKRLTAGVPAMRGYGAVVKEYLPMMREMIEQRYGKERNKKTRDKLLEILEKTANDIAPESISIQPYIDESLMNE